jgi:hypothetical protein
MSWEVSKERNTHIFHSQSSTAAMVVARIKDGVMF